MECLGALRREDDREVFAVVGRQGCDRINPRVQPFRFLFRKEGVCMLVLSRKKNESVVIDLSQQSTLDYLASMPPEERMISIITVEIRGDKARYGINAPKDVPVHRREVYEAIKRNSGVAIPGKHSKSKAEGDAA